MGQFLNQLRAGTKENHEKVGNLPFLKRYESKDVKLTDHYLHLRQLLPVYAALENILTNPACSLTLSEDKLFLLHRSEQLRADIAFLEQHVPTYVKNWVSPHTNEYVDYLNSGLDDRVVFGHFMARIVGDLFGGQRIKNRMAEHYVNWRIAKQGSVEGISFYEFPNGTLKDLLQGLDAMSNEMGEDSKKVMIDAANDGIARHFPIFEDLEAKRDQVQRYNFRVHLFTGGAVLAVSAAAALGAARFLS